jgi:nucleotide-binding universal stress UspA family protein
MMQRILVPLDGSPLAEHALAVAAKLARSTDGTLILVQALPMTFVYESPFVPEIIPPANLEEEPRAQAYLTEQASLPMLSGLSIETEVLSGTPALSILDAAATHRADMIVMTSHGRAGISRWVLGSVAEHVARQAHISVLVLRQHQLPFWTEGADLVATSTSPLQVDTIPELRVLVPLDGSALAESALPPAATCAYALARGVERTVGLGAGSIACSLHLVLVVRPLDALAENMPEALVVSGAETYLKQMADRIEKDHPGVRVSWEVIAGSDVAAVLVSMAEGSKSAEAEEIHLAGSETERTDVSAGGSAYTLLAMATHGRTGIMRWAWGSITERVVQKTEIPVLLVHPHHNGQQTPLPS